MTKDAQKISTGQPANLLTVPKAGGKMPLDTVSVHNVGCFIHMAGQEVWKYAFRDREVAGIAEPE